MTLMINPWIVLPPSVPPPYVPPALDPTLPDPTYHFSSDSGVLNKSALPASNGDQIGTWGNQGTSSDATTTTAANAPLYMTGGRNGLPYIQGVHADQRFFDNLTDAAHPSGLTQAASYTCFIVTDQVAVNSPILGSGLSGGGKARAIFTNTPTFSWYKTQVSRTVVPGDFNIIGFSVQDSGLFRYISPTSPYASFSQTTNPVSTAVTPQFLRNTGAATYFDGRLYEFIYFKPVMGGVQQQLVLDYLNAKYAL
jgi:hypothetical protein